MSSALLAATSDADIIEVGEHGFRHTSRKDLDLTFHWRRYLSDPRAYLRHVIDDPDESNDQTHTQ